MIPAVIPRRSVTYSFAEADDADGIKTSFASAAAPVSLDASDYNGARVADSGTTWAKGLPRTVNIARSDSAGSYTVDPIVLTGTWRGQTVTESLTPADADGDDVLRGTQLWDTPPSIAIPAQVDTDGLFEIGVGDVGAPSGDHFCAVELVAADDLNVQYDGGHQDKIPIPAAQVSVPKWIAPQRILTSQAISGPTAVGFTVYLP